MSQPRQENIPHEFISIKNLGVIRRGSMEETTEEARRWTPGYENYTFTEKDGGTLLQVDLDSDISNKIMLEESWPDALNRLKTIAESTR